MLKYPNMRRELIAQLRDLANPEYQVAAWVRGDLPEGSVDSMDDAVNFVYDLSVEDSPSHAVGYFLRNEEEVLALKPLLCALDSFCARYGREQDVSKCLASPEWARVVGAASDALKGIRD